MSYILSVSRDTGDFTMMRKGNSILYLCKDGNGNVGEVNATWVRNNIKEIENARLVDGRIVYKEIENLGSKVKGELLFTIVCESNQESMTVEIKEGTTKEYLEKEIVPKIAAVIGGSKRITIYVTRNINEKVVEGFNVLYSNSFFIDCEKSIYIIVKNSVKTIKVDKRLARGNVLDLRIRYSKVGLRYLDESMSPIGVLISGIKVKRGIFICGMCNSITMQNVYIPGSLDINEVLDSCSFSFISSSVGSLSGFVDKSEGSLGKSNSIIKEYK